MSNLQIVHVALAAGLMLLWLLLFARGPRAVETTGELVVLRYGPRLRGLALAFALTPTLMMAAYAIWAFHWRNEAALNIAGASFLATSVIAGLLLVEVTRVQIVVTEEGLTRFSPWSAPATLKWIEVERIRYSAVNRWFIVDGAQRTIRVSRHLGGIDVFAATVRRKVASERCAQAMKRWGKFSRRACSP